MFANRVGQILACVVRLEGRESEGFLLGNDDVGYACLVGGRGLGEEEETESEEETLVAQLDEGGARRGLRHGFYVSRVGRVVEARKGAVGEGRGESNVERECLFLVLRGHRFQEDAEKLVGRRGKVVPCALVPVVWVFELVLALKG